MASAYSSQWVRIPVPFGINFWILFRLLLHRGFSLQAFTGHANAFTMVAKKLLVLIKLPCILFERIILLFGLFYFSINSLILHASGSILFPFHLI